MQFSSCHKGNINAEGIGCSLNQAMHTKAVFNVDNNKLIQSLPAHGHSR